MMCGLNVLEPVHGFEENPEAEETDEEIEENNHFVYFEKEDAKKMPVKGERLCGFVNGVFEPGACKKSFRQFSF